MATVTTTICDACGEPIEIKPGLPHNYYVEVHSADLGHEPGPGGAALLIAQQPPLERPLTFHNLDCLRKWVSKAGPVPLSSRAGTPI